MQVPNGGSAHHWQAADKKLKPVQLCFTPATHAGLENSFVCAAGPT